MTYLVTGAAGFIGYHLSNAILNKGEAVVGIDDCNTYYDPSLKRDRIALLSEKYGKKFKFYEMDFANNQALCEILENDTIDQIAHMGAQAGVRYSLENPHAYVQSNLVGHTNILELARARKVKHLVYASSSSVYGENRKLPFEVIDRVDHPVSLYAATKKANELMSETYSHLYRIPQTGLRFFTVYGPFGRPDMAMWIFTKAILENRPIPVFNHGNMSRDFTYVDDIIDGVTKCIENPPSDDGKEKPGGSHAPHAIYNIGNNRPERLGTLINLLEQACDKKAIIEYKDMQPGDVKATYANIDPINNDLGFSPKTPLSEGVKIFVNWYREYHHI